MWCTVRYLWQLVADLDGVSADQNKPWCRVWHCVVAHVNLIVCAFSKEDNSVIHAMMWCHVLHIQFPGRVGFQLRVSGPADFQARVDVTGHFPCEKISRLVLDRRKSVTFQHQVAPCPCPTWMTSVTGRHLRNQVAVPLPDHNKLSI